MGKSKHPSLLKKALNDMARVDKVVKKDAASLKAIAKSCTVAQKMATSTARDFDTQLKYVKDVMEKYAHKVLEIEQHERDMDGAKGDKNKEKELKKKLAAAEKEADGHRKEYNLAGEVFGTLALLMAGELDRLQIAGDKMASGWS